MKYQLTCPKCHHEFQYDNGYLDRNITRLGNEIRDIQLQLAQHNLLPYDEQRRRTDWWRRAKLALATKQKEFAELKSYRKIADQQVSRMRFDILKGLVREQLGQAAFDKLLAQVDEETEAYRVSGLMRHEYSHAGGRGVTSINNV